MGRDRLVRKLANKVIHDLSFFELRLVRVRTEGGIAQVELAANRALLQVGIEKGTGRSVEKRGDKRSPSGASR
jgi:hypothetical protein